MPAEFHDSVQKIENMQSCCWIEAEIFESLDHIVMQNFLATLFGPIFPSSYFPACLFH